MGKMVDNFSFINDYARKHQLSGNSKYISQMVSDAAIGIKKTIFGDTTGQQSQQASPAK